MEEKGFISLDRKMLNWEWFKDSNTTHVFVYMLLKAEWADVKYRGEIIKRGSFVSTLSEIAVGTGLTVQNVRTALRHLQLTNDVTYETNRQYSVFTVVNYNKYQTPNKRKASQLTNDQQTTNKRLTNDQQTTNIPSYLYNNITNKQLNNITRGCGGKNEDEPTKKAHDFSSHTNIENLNHVLTNNLFETSETIVNDELLKGLLVEWMEYKDERKPKSTNRYGTEKGLKKFLNLFVKNYSEYGYDAIKHVVDKTISSNYAGLVWDWLEKNSQPGGKRNEYMQAIKNRVNEVDNWV